MAYPMWNKQKTGIIVDRGDGITAFIEGGAEYDALESTVPAWHEYPVSVNKTAIVTERAAMTCTPMQGILALGEANWNIVLAYRDRQDAEGKPMTSWAEKTVIDGAQEWRRNSQNIQFFQYLLNFTDEQVDALFRTAMLIDA